MVLVTGRLDVQEEGTVKLLAERIEPVPEQAPASPPQPEKKAPSPKAGLYLRLPTDSGEVYTHVQRLLQVFEGDLPVYIRFADSGRLVRAPRDWWVTPESILLSELTKLLGEENMAIIP